MKILTKEKGITLIALVITIIVMLILVAVTINVAMGENGLIATTQKAARDQEYETIYDVIKGAIVLKEDGTINTEETKNAIIKLGYEVTPKSNDLIEIKGKKGTYTYKLTTKEISKSEENNQSDTDLAFLRTYLLGENGSGINLFGGVLNPENLEFSNNEAIFLSVLVTSDSANDLREGNIYFKYKNKCYRVQYAEIDETTIMSKGDIHLIYEPSGREGQKVQYSYDGSITNKKEWTILYDNGENLEIISPEAMGNLALGAVDTESIGETNIEKTIYSYNNAIGRINNYCASLVTNINKKSVRSVGSNPNNPSAENSSLYTSDSLANVSNGIYNGIAKSTDINCEQDIVRMAYHGIGGVSNIDEENRSYWLASRCSSEGTRGPSFGIRAAYDNQVAEVDNYGIWYVENGQAYYATNPNRAVRPVVKISSSEV